MTRLDIVIPVYNEGGNIVAVLSGLARDVKTPARVPICYDMENDDTFPAIRDNSDEYKALVMEFVSNSGRGAHAAVMAGLPPVLRLWWSCFRPTTISIREFRSHGDAGESRLRRRLCQPVYAGRKMEGCPWLKALLVRTAAFTLYVFARLPTHDPTSGFRAFPAG